MQCSLDLYVHSVTLCNSLAVLVSQSSLVEFIRRVSVLTKLHKCWTDGHSNVKLVCSFTDGGHHSNEPDCRHLSETGNSSSDRIVLPSLLYSCLPADLVEKVDRNKDDDSDSLSRQLGADQYAVIVQNLSRQMMIRSGRQRKDLLAGSDSTTSSAEDETAIASEDIVGSSFPVDEPSPAAAAAAARPKSKAVRLRKTARSHSPIGKASKRSGSGDNETTKERTNKNSIDSNDENSSSCNCLESAKRPHVHKRSCKKPIVCSVCGRQFSRWSWLRQHFLVHTGERPWLCRYPDCGRRFSQHGTLVTHERTHVSTPSFVCVLCGATYRAPRSLNEHVLKFHTDKSSLPPQQCSQCGRTFLTSRALRTHVQETHCETRRYACDECPKRFKSSKTLRVHKMSLHSTKRPWNCSVCGKAFTLAGNMRTHMRVHTGAKPYECKTCGQHFSHSSTLKGHMVTHGDRPTDQVQQPARA